MRLDFGVLIALLSHLHLVIADYKTCPLLGPDIPPPYKLSSSDIWKNATANTTSILKAAISANLYKSANTSWAVEVFSIHEARPLYSFYHTATELATSPGTKKVDTDSFFRIGSISKLWTVFIFLIEVGDVRFNDPVTKWVPELRALAKGPKDPVNKVDWNSITLGNLASQMSGLGRDYSAIGELTVIAPTTDFTAFGLPPLSKDEIPPCGIDPVCNRKQFFAGFGKRHPVHGPATKATYSNVAFQILGYALENITGKSYETMLNKDLIQKLHLNGSSYKVPTNSSRGVIPISVNASGWDLDIGDEGPAGNIYSSSRDLSTIGRAILSSSLLPRAQTNRWLKPTTFISSAYAGIGAPWEILRSELTQPPKLIDFYTKGGGIGVYTSILFLVPDLDIGLVALAAGPASAFLVPQLFAETFVAAAESVARVEAGVNYAGRYAADGAQLNSSIVFSTDPNHAGLGIDSWISNGTDVINVFGLQFLGLPGKNVSARLYPTGLVTPLKSGGFEESWRAVIEAKVEATGTATGPLPFLRLDCMNWGSVDAEMYGSNSLDELVFTVGKDRVAVSVNPTALRVSLKKE